MNKLLIAAVMTLSTSAFANVCHVDMVDTLTGRLIERFRSYDDFEGCKEGMKDCRKEIRMRGLVNRADCVREDFASAPLPNPSPLPTPNYGHDARRPVQIGESVIFNNNFHTILGSTISGLYTVRYKDSWETKVHHGIHRSNLAVTSGCNLGLCVNEKAIDVESSTYVKVVGLGFSDDFVTETYDSWKSLTSGIRREQLAQTKGCVTRFYSQICVGNEVMTTKDNYFTVIGIQTDGLVVLHSQKFFGKIHANIDPTKLIIVR